MEQISANGYGIALVGDELLALGFKLAGVKRSFPAKTTQDAEATLKNLVEDKSIGLIIISYRVAGLIKDRQLRHSVDSSLLPLIIQVPEKGEEDMQAEVIRNLMKRAIGVDITGKEGSI